MKKETLFLCIALLSGNAYSQQWPKALPEAKPASRWWWLGSAVDKDNLTYNISEYSKAGIGGLEITPIYGVQGNDKNDISYLSPKWMEMLRHTQDVARKNGIEVDMNNGTGWPFGGPDVNIKQAASKAVFKTYSINGGKSIELNIQLDDEKQKNVAYLSRIMAYQNNKAVDITSKAKSNTLHWNAPKGEWKIVVLYVGKTFQMVKRAAPGGEGYVIDHFDKNAVTHYFKKFDEAFKESRCNFPHTFFNDSYEVYKADWTPTLLEEFAKRRGYKLEDHFPQFIDEKRNETTCRIVADYRETLSDLLIENFTCEWTKWAHKHNSITRNQAHGSPSNLIDTYAAVDIPEIEGFGLSQFNIKGLRQDSLTRKNFSDISMLKYASSAAHLTGKKFTSSETFTWLTEHFRTSLSQCKPDLDLMFTAGVNHVFFHGTCYSPKEAAWPGWKFYASVDMSPTNTIWRDAPYFFEYITRCQSFLQWGNPDNDFLVYLPVYDMWHDQPGRLLQFDIHSMERRAPQFIEAIQKIINSGYDVDYISDKFIRTAKYKNGKIVTTGNSEYKAIVVPGAKIIPSDVLQKLMTLAKDGATVVFLDNYPSDVPGFFNHNNRLNEFNKIKGLLPNDSFESSKEFKLGKGKIIIGKDYSKTLQLCNVKEENMRTEYGLHCIRRSNPTGYHYFISSLQKNDVDGWITLGIDAKQAVLFNPMNGSIGNSKIRTVNGETQVYIQLKSGESVILQTYNDTLNSKVNDWKYYKPQQLSINLSHGWNLFFIKSTPVINGTFNIDQPVSWTEIGNKDAKTNMGTALYSIDFDMPSVKADDWILNLGDVRESARVRLNGKDIGCVWAVPYMIGLGDNLVKGKNHLEVEVTNLPANYISKMDRDGNKWRIFKEINVVDLNYKKKDYSDWGIMPSGLNGNVELIPINYK